MTEPVERLQDLVVTRLRELGSSPGKPMSAREAARRADGMVSYETLRNLARGVRHTGRITDRVAHGIARALQVPPSQVYEAAGVLEPGDRWEWPQRFDRLNPAQRQIVEDVAAAIMEAFEQGRRARD